MVSTPPVAGPVQGHTVAPPGAATALPNTNALVVSKIDALLTKLDAAAKAEEAKAVTSIKTFLSKHWPWMAGVAVAATRFLNL